MTKTEQEQMLINQGKMIEKYADLSKHYEDNSCRIVDAISGIKEVINEVNHTNVLHTKSIDNMTAQLENLNNKTFKLLKVAFIVLAVLLTGIKILEYGII